MKNKARIYYFSHLILFIAGSAYLLDIIMGGKLGQLFVLSPNLIFRDYEWWRLVTFPLAPDSIESTILFMLTFFIFAPKLEEIFHNWLYPLMLFLAIFLQGAILTLILWNNDIIITGMEGISFFVLAIFTLLNIKKRLIILGKFYIRTILFSTAIITFWFSAIFLHSLISENYVHVIEGIYNFAFGISAGLTVYLQIRYTKHNRLPVKKYHTETKIPDIPNQEELSLALISNNELKKFNERLQEEFSKPDYSTFTPEDRLNEILEKIYAQGRNSLSQDENKFLDDYSKHL